MHISLHSRWMLSVAFYSVIKKKKSFKKKPIHSFFLFLSILSHLSVWMLLTVLILRPQISSYQSSYREFSGLVYYTEYFQTQKHLHSAWYSVPDVMRNFIILKNAYKITLCISYNCYLGKVLSSICSPVQKKSYFHRRETSGPTSQSNQ